MKSIFPIICRKKELQILNKRERRGVLAVLKLITFLLQYARMKRDECARQLGYDFSDLFNSTKHPDDLPEKIHICIAEVKILSFLKDEIELHILKGDIRGK